MPLFVVEQNRIADNIGVSALRFYLHTAAPTDASPTNARTTAGGGAFASGVLIAATDISGAATGDIDVDVNIDFGTATAAVGTVTHLSAYRGTAAVGYWDIPDTTIANNDSFLINANSLRFLGSST